MLWIHCGEVQCPVDSSRFRIPVVHNIVNVTYLILELCN
jgi:hypothetical protein